MSSQISLISFLAQVLLLADNIIVKQLLLDKETNTVGSVCIKHMNNFSEFVKVTNTPSSSRKLFTYFRLSVILAKKWWS